MRLGNVFTPACHSVHGGGGVHQNPLLGRHSPGQTLPLDSHTSSADTPLGTHPPDRHPLGRYPPPARPPGQTPPLGRDPSKAGRHPPPPKDSHCSGRYVCYWNAFLLVNSFIMVVYQNILDVFRTQISDCTLKKFSQRQPFMDQSYVCALSVGCLMFVRFVRYFWNRPGIRQREQ